MSSVYLYADDSKLSRIIDCQEDCDALQEDIDNAVKFAEKWQLRFNISKCKIMHVSNKLYADAHSEYLMPGTESNVIVKLSETVVERDLGIWMDNQLKFTAHVEKAVIKANQLLGLIKRSFIYTDIIC